MHYKPFWSNHEWNLPAVQEKWLHCMILKYLVKEREHNMFSSTLWTRWKVFLTTWSRCEEHCLTHSSWRKQQSGRSNGLQENKLWPNSRWKGPLTVERHRCAKSQDQEEDDEADFQSGEEPSDEGFRQRRRCCPQTVCCKTSQEPAQFTHISKRLKVVTGTGQMKLFPGVCKRS